MAAGGTITAANAVLLLTVAGLFDSPQPLQGFSTDDIFDTDNLVSGEPRMGVDGRLSAGWVPNPVVMNINFMADSPSILLFERWVLTEQQSLDKFIAGMHVSLKAINRKYTLTRGFLISGPPTPRAARVLEARRYTLQWESLTPSPQ